MYSRRPIEVYSHTTMPANPTIGVGMVPIIAYNVWISYIYAMPIMYRFHTSMHNLIYSHHAFTYRTIPTELVGKNDTSIRTDVRRTYYSGIGVPPLIGREK